MAATNVLILFEAQGGRLAVLESSGQQMKLSHSSPRPYDKPEELALRLLEALEFPAKLNEQWLEVQTNNKRRHVFTYRSDSMTALNTHLNRTFPRAATVDGARINANFVGGREQLLGLPQAKSKRGDTSRRQKLLETLSPN